MPLLHSNNDIDFFTSVALYASSVTSEEDYDLPADSQSQDQSQG